MGVRPEPKTKRNFEMYKRWKEGDNPYDLVREYNINLSRFYQIVRWVERKLPIDK